MRILILGAGKMGSFFADIFSFDHETAVFDTDPKRLRFMYNTQRFTAEEEIKTFRPGVSFQHRQLQAYCRGVAAVGAQEWA